MKHKRMTIAAGCLLLTLGLFVGCGGQAGEKEYEKGLKAWKQGDLVQARTLLEKASGRLSGEARKAAAYNDLGLILWQLGETETAAEAFTSACDLSETVTSARLNLATALFHCGRYDEAKISLRMFMGQFPENKDALALQSLIAAEKRDWAQAARVMADAVSADPGDPAAQNALALAELHHKQNSTTAINRLKQIASQHPDYAPARYNLAVIYDQWLNDTAKALPHYQAYLEKAGAEGTHVEVAQQAVARINRGGASAGSMNEAEASKYFTDGYRLLNEKKYTESIIQFRKAVSADPRHKNSYYNMGMAYYSLKKYDESSKALRNAVRIDPQFADARYVLVLSQITLKNWDVAEREAKALQAVDATRGKQMLDYISQSRN